MNPSSSPALESSLHQFLSRRETRRAALRKLGLAGIGVGGLGYLARRARAATIIGPTGLTLDQQVANDVTANNTDIEMLNFALNLEFLGAEFYAYATTGSRLNLQNISSGATGTTGTAGTSGTASAMLPTTTGNIIVKTNPKVPFVTPLVQQFATEIANDEAEHVRLLLTSLGSNAIAEPTIDLQNSFNRAATLAGIGSTFDPFASEANFLLAAFLLEDTETMAYHGAISFLANGTRLADTAGILATEGYHAGFLRTMVCQLGTAVQAQANALATARYNLVASATNVGSSGSAGSGSSASGGTGTSVGGSGTDLASAGTGQTGVTVNGQARIVPADGNGLVYYLTPQQVLNVVYLSPSGTPGGFFPSGVNGTMDLLSASSGGASSTGSAGTSASSTTSTSGTSSAGSPTGGTSSTGAGTAGSSPTTGTGTTSGTGGSGSGTTSGAGAAAAPGAVGAPGSATSSGTSAAI